MPRLTFHGAAETVTGSKYLLETDGAAGPGAAGSGGTGPGGTGPGGTVLFDCGLFQGLKALRLMNWAPLAFDAQAVQAVVLTHAHIDHIGYLPRFVKQGFRGPAYCTPATEDLAEIMLLDAAKIQEGDAEYANRKGFSKHHPALPLFDADDAAQALRQLKAVRRGEWFQAAGPIWCRYHDAGHLLGSAMIEVEIRSAEKPLRILFSGDVGRYDAPLYHDPSPPPACDYLICESTYGNREHPHVNLLDELADAVTQAIRRGGVMLVPAFAVGRSQQLIYLLRVLIEQNRIPELPIFVDSPMAVDATSVYCAHAEDHDLSEGELTGAHCVLDGRNVHLARTVSESKAINQVPGPAVIIASSGMMTGGRILHHLKQRLPSERNTILLAGFMAEGTRGRLLEDGADRLRIHGGDVPARAAITKLSGMSGHAGHSELLRWLSPLAPPKRTFVTHGEKPSATALADELRTTRGWKTCVPRLGESFDLESP
jgi:metallo-beta-lactamase family protein